ncbi:sulfotransferase domain-containing protein [Colwellia sp. MB02u-18]|uniref:sulfotransferase family protein n=1 Tax=unclassified Colwellia TaxID=196834 RepID=UPI0015F38A3D|nr:MULTISPECIES: sulfotransferase [unclassified Colwellia]MBA6267060.1 sulfotransferase domain-containing protein [Colwellia sp. MB3u-43]MBA6321984.1 sulfotransferase domain-containing protein [Colwellia sp. MB02u-19]MBA6325214.1 sulfotransferase domain-containing protein [Colwellia sp. MB02u-18]MBA6330233.1 sulfotransferase domain-containing protein [Colwellia sp. MB02u-12]
MKCNLIIPGFPKCGTSSLHQYLDLHPEISMSKEKEPHYFSHDDQYLKGEAWYDRLFSYDLGFHPSFCGESSTSYCYDEKALRRIKKKLINPKVILLLRDPVERLLSHYRWLWALEKENRPLLQAIHEEEAKGYDIHNPLKNGGFATYLRGSRYSYYVPLIEDIFGSENVLVLSSDELKACPQAFLDKCFDFLGVVSHHVTVEIRTNQTVDKVTQRNLGFGWVYNLLPAKLIRAIDPDNNVKNFIKKILGQRRVKPPSLDESTILAVGEMLKHDVEFYKTRFNITV